MSHTAGPWKLDWNSVPGFSVHPHLPTMHYVLVYSSKPEDYDVEESLRITGYMRREDALLIHAAPDLSDALHDLLSQATDACAVIDEFAAMPVQSLSDKFSTTVARLRSKLEAARAAIAKAEGRS